jgi:enamine deaminase RidA (YjgF/YER057c/UK114 family)
MTAFKPVVTARGKSGYERFHFADAADTGDHLFCSGVIGTDASGKVPEDPAEEFENAWRGVRAVLEAAGLGMADVVEYTSFHVGLQAHLRTFMKVRDRHLAEPWPAWTAIGITELAVPGARVEIRVTARRHGA